MGAAADLACGRGAQRAQVADTPGATASRRRNTSSTPTATPRRSAPEFVITGGIGVRRRLVRMNGGPPPPDEV
jgi:hypothetical protein